MNTGLNWNVFVEDINARRIITFNIFEHGGFFNDCIRLAKEYGDDFPEFANQLRKSLAYFFWSKCEWEIVLSSWPPSDKIEEVKIDVYDQVMANWEAFLLYIQGNIDLLINVEASKG